MANSNQNNWRSNLGMIILVVSGILAIVGEVLARRYFIDWKYVSEPVHSSVEIVGAAIGIIMAALLLMMWNRQKDNQKYLWISSALLSMAIMDVFHASVSPGNLFVWLHTVAMLVGGVFFVFVWLPENILKMKIAILPAIAIIGSVIFGVISVVYSGVMPLVVEKGLMTDIAKNINIVAGILFLIAGARFMINYMDSGKSEDVLFANFCLLSAIAALFFYMSSLWNADWWFWHIVRLWAFMSTLGVWLATRENEIVEKQII